MKVNKFFYCVSQLQLSPGARVWILRKAYIVWYGFWIGFWGFFSFLWFSREILNGQNPYKRCIYMSRKPDSFLACLVTIINQGSILWELRLILQRFKEVSSGGFTLDFIGSWMLKSFKMAILIGLRKDGTWFLINGWRGGSLFAAPALVIGALLWNRLEIKLNHVHYDAYLSWNGILTRLFLGYCFLLLPKFVWEVLFRWLALS